MMISDKNRVIIYMNMQDITCGIEQILINLKEQLDSLTCYNYKQINSLICSTIRGIDDLIIKTCCKMMLKIKWKCNSIHIQINDIILKIQLLTCNDDNFFDLIDTINTFLNIIMRWLTDKFIKFRYLSKRRHILAHIVDKKINDSRTLINSLLVPGTNINISKLSGPQSTTSIAINQSNPSQIIIGCNDIYRPEMDAFISKDSGTSWIWSKLPLPSMRRGICFGHYPSVMFVNNVVYYTYVVINTDVDYSTIYGTMIAITQINLTNNTNTSIYLNHISGSFIFNEKPFITTDNSTTSPYKGRIYVVWNTKTHYNNSTSNTIKLAYSINGCDFIIKTINTGPAVSGANACISPNGILNIVWYDTSNNNIMFTSSNNGGISFDLTRIIANVLGTDICIPPQRHAIVYPVVCVDNDGILYCCWMDCNHKFRFMTNIYISKSNNGGSLWSNKILISDNSGLSYQFNQWMTIDPVTNKLHITWRDTRNDKKNKKVDVYYTNSTDQGTTFSTNKKITTVQSDETKKHADRNQYGDYEGHCSYGGKTIISWCDSRLLNTLQEEIFVAIV
jgi:hypothetical protein